jgi:hypothetical protein
MGFTDANVSTDSDPAYLMVSARCEPGAMSKQELEETCGRALQALELRLLIPAKVAAFPGPESFASKSRRRMTKWNWDKAFTDGPHHASHYRRIVSSRIAGESDTPSTRRSGLAATPNRSATDRSLDNSSHRREDSKTSRLHKTPSSRTSTVCTASGTLKA